MIVYGLTMQGKPEGVPKEVAAWLIERNSRYPNIDFTVDCRDSHPSEVEEFESAARKYSRIYYLTAPFSAGNVLNVLSIIFPYLKQIWIIKIVGGLDSEGKIADRTKTEVIKPLPVQLRAEIAGLPTIPGLPLPSEMERLNKENVVIIRRKDEPPLEKPTEMIPLPSDFRWTSEVTMSGEELSNLPKLLSNPQTRDEILRAYSEKDWETFKRLLKE